MINLGTILKPLMLMQGVKNFKIQFKPADLIVEITGIQNGQPFTTQQTFTELEQAINGTTADDPAGSTHRQQIDDPGRS